MSTIGRKISKAENTVRASFNQIRNAYNGYPHTAAQWDFFEARIREIAQALSERNAAIEEERDLS